MTGMPCHHVARTSLGVQSIEGMGVPGVPMGDRETLPWEELEYWGQPWVYGRSWGAGEHPRAQNSLFLLPGRAERGAQGIPTPRRQLTPLSFPGPSQASLGAGVTPSPACRAQFRHFHNHHPRALLCQSSPGAGCALSQAGQALPPALGIIPGPRDGGVGLGQAAVPCLAKLCQ